MRTLAAVLGLCMVCSCYALKIMSIDIPGADNSLQTSKDLRLPVHSNLQAGIVHRQSTAIVNFSSPMFIIGDDELSREWLRHHAAQMKAVNALGIVTNIQTAESLQQLEELAGLPLMPVNIDELSDLLHVNHYPFVFESGVVWQ